MPYVPYLIYGTVTNSLGAIEVSAVVEITTSIGVKKWNTDSDGVYIANLADTGYTSGETITIETADEFDNEISEDSVVVAGGSSESNIVLSPRKLAQGSIVGYASRTILHSVGNSPITFDNPIPVKGLNPKSDVRFDANDAQPNYVGLNFDTHDADTSQPIWTIYKFTYSGSNVTRVQKRIGQVWNDRTSLF